MLCRGVKGVFYRKKEVSCQKDFALIDNQLTTFSLSLLEFGISLV